MSRWINSVYTRLLLLFVVMALPLQGCHALIYRWCAQTMRSQLVSTAQANLSFIQEDLESNVRLIAQQLEYLLQNRTVTRLHYYSNARVSDYYLYIMDTQNTLKLVQSSNPFLEEVRVYYPRLLRIISSSQSMSLALSQEEIQQVVDSFRAQGCLLTEREDQLSVESIHPASYYDADKVPYYLASARLKRDKITTLLSSFDLDGDSFVFLRNEATGTFYRNALAESQDARPPEGLLLPEEGFSQETVLLKGAEYICLSCRSAYLNCSFYQLIPLARLFAFPDQMLRFTRMFTLLLALFIAAYAVAIYRMVQRPINDLTLAFRLTQTGAFDTRLNDRYLYEFNTLAGGFNSMVEKIRQLIQSTYESRIRTQQAEYKQLQSQINPHFLYNSFYLLRHCLREDTAEHAEELCSYLGDYFRFITDQSSDLLPLCEELEHALTYLHIQQMRFGEFLCAEIQPLPEELHRTPVPRLILQPLFENAIEHGVPTQAETALVRLSFEVDEKTVRILFEDNGDHLSDERLKQMCEALSSASNLREEGHALLNTHRRLCILYGDDCGLRLERSPLGGLCVLLTLRRSDDENGKENAHGRGL